MKIDIKPKIADSLHENEVSDLFTSQDTYEKIMNRETMVIMGPKGTGKSMILRYMSMPIQSERHKSKTSVLYDNEHCGVYINCSKHYFGQIKEKTNSNTQQTSIWKENFIHMFNLTICYTLFENIENSKKYPIFQMTKLEEKTVCKKISIVLDCKEVYSFEDISNEVRKKMRVLYANFDKKEAGVTTVPGFISELQDILRSKISGFKNKSLFILLDNHNELTDIQRQMINEIISIRTIFKIATLPLKFSTERELDKSISFTNDFETVDIGITNLSINSPKFNATKCFLRDVANKRLKVYGVKVETLLSDDKAEDFKHKTPYFGFENFVLLSSGNARMFLKLLNIAIQKWSDSGKSIPVSVQQEAAYTLAYELMRKDINFLPKQYRTKIRSFILKIGLLFKNYYKRTGEYYLQIGIKDPENISEITHELLSLAIERNYIMQSPVIRESRKGFKLESVTLLNALLPYFELPLKTHQVREMSAVQLNNLFNKDSTIKDTEIIDKKTIDYETLPSYMNRKNNLITNSDKSRNAITDETRQIIKHITNNELGVFVGSGISKEIGYPTGTELAKKIALHFDEDYVGEDLTAVVIRILKRHKKGDLVKVIKDLFKNIEEKESPSYTKLADFGLDEVFTTNWDSSIENAFKKIHVDTEVVVRDDHIPLIGNHKPVIYKLHGSFDHPDLFAITEDDYNEIEDTRDAIITTLKNILVRKHFLFLGYSMDDLDLLKIMEIVKVSQGKVGLTSYAAILNVSEEKKKILEEMDIILIPIKGETLINDIHQEIMRHK